MHAHMQVLARLTQTVTTLSSSSRKQLPVCATQVLWHNSAEQQRYFGVLTSSTPPPDSRETGATVPVACPAKLPKASWHGLHTLPLAAASSDDPGHCCDNHDHDHHQHHPRQPSSQTKPASSAAGQSHRQLGSGKSLAQILHCVML